MASAASASCSGAAGTQCVAARRPPGLPPSVRWRPGRTLLVRHSPSYLTACSRSDPKINDCVLKNGRHAMPFLLNGDPRYRVPKLNPLVIPELHLEQGTDSVGLRLTWKNAELQGLKDAVFQEADFNTDTMHLRLEFFLPRIVIAGTYSASGRVLLLPVTGSGPSNVTALNMKITYELDYKVVKRRNGKEYIDIGDHKITLRDIGFMSLKFDNLFGGDRVLSANLNSFLNENWKDLAKEFGPGVTDAIGEVFRIIIKGFCDVVPYDLVIKP